MNREDLIQEIKRLFFARKDNKRLSHSKIKKEYPDLLDQIYQHTQFLTPNSELTERIYCLFNNITEVKICPVCKKNTIKYHPSIGGYSKTCSVQCVSPDRNIQTQKTLLQRGLPTIGSKEFRDKAKASNKMKYGDENYSNREKAKSTYIKKFGGASPFSSAEVKQKSKNTMLDKYGVENAFSSVKIRNKIKQTCLEKYGKQHYTQTDECKIKTKNTCLDKYGVTNPGQSKDAKEKAKKTSIGRYGTDNPMKSEKIQNKIKKTCLERYGTTSVLSCPEIRNKIEQTCIERYGVDNPIKSDEIKNKIEQTCIERYGVASPFSCTEIRNKIENTSLKKYGTAIPAASKQTRNKIEQTCIERYGVASPFSCTEIRNVAIKARRENHPEYDLPIDTIKQLYKTKPATEIAKIFNVTDVTIGNRLKSHGIPTIPHRQISTFETEIYNYIRANYNGETITKTRTTISPKELDIYLPDLKLAFEINGAYYHSSKFLNKYYHYNKSKLCLEKDIQLVHIFDYQWLSEKEKIQSFILNKLGKSKRIYARNCEIRSVNKQDSEQFYRENHLQGYANSKINIGLYYQNNLVSLMSFSKSRFNKHYEWELTHFCTKLYMQVIGGASKLFSYFIKQNNPKNVITYCNLLYSIGILYEKLGFKNIKTIQPNYCYIKDNKIYSKLLFKKKYFSQSLQSHTETEITRSIGAYKVYDAGKYIYVWHNSL